MSFFSGKKGYTTGSCATAAAVSALLALAGKHPQQIKIILPDQKTIDIPVASCGIGTDFGWAEVIKDAGDDPDVTHGHIIGACVRLIESGHIVIKGGKGVGVVTKPGLKVAVGEPAINPVPKQMILDNIKKTLVSLGIKQGVEITIYVPEGEKLAEKTLNSKLGIIGGISILGTTGIVEPMSEERFKLSLLPQLEIARAAGYKEIILTPGRAGQKAAEKFLAFPEDAIILSSNFIGFMLEHAIGMGFKKVIIFGSLGKLVKLAGGIFYTHSKIADARREILACHTALLGFSSELVRKVFLANTTEEIIDLLKTHNGEKVLWQIAAEAKKRAEDYIFNEAQVEVIITNMAGIPVAWSSQAGLLLGEAT